MLGLSDMVLGCVPPMVRCKCQAILTWWKAGPPMVRCECWAFLTWLLDVFLPWSDVSVGRAFLTWLLDVFLPWSDVSVGWAVLTKG